jgi:hypothetical protein
MTVQIQIAPRISSDQLFDFYARNNICEVGFGKEVAAKVLGASGLVVAAFEGDRLVGIARATFDGLTAAVMEMSLACELQGKDLVHQNGSLIEKDDSGIGLELGRVFVDELLKLGASFIFVTIEPREGGFYRSIGFKENAGQISCFIDHRPLCARRDAQHIEEIIFVEVKSGSARLNHNKRSLEAAIDNKRVR